MARPNSNFSLAIKAEGGLFPVDFLIDLSSLSKEIEGLEPEQYHLSEREKINEAINRAYTRLQGFWLSFKGALDKIPPDDYATSVTKEKWLLPIFECLGYGRLLPADPIIVGERTYKPSHAWSHVPIHLVGFRVDLDRRSTAGGARVSSPHSLVQELLNQSDGHLWAFVSNGRKLRILRDNASLTRQAFVEFDLESIFEGDGYSDFRLLWLLCHQSRVEGIPPESCYLEIWKDAAQRAGIRVRDQLRVGVEKALEIFGTGFLRHRSNGTLQTRVRNGEIAAEDFYRQLLHLIYRLLFLFVTEDRNVLLRPEATATQRKTYYDYYSTARLRAVAGKRRGTIHDDLWSQLSFVFDKLSSDLGCAELALPALGSFLWSSAAMPIFAGCRLHNADFLEALRCLCFTTDSGVRRLVRYGQLESEELGSIYESLLEQIPYLDPTSEPPIFVLRQAAGSERKTTGSYYTPTSLVNCLLDSALEPLLDRASKSASPEEAILNLKICDPACGSGHFLIAAAHRTARRLASIRSGDAEPGPEYRSAALRDVISHCIYGVDVNEMAVELCKVSLWLQSAVQGAPLSFLEHKIKCGNSLLGSTPELVENGIPDEAFDPLEGDDKETVKRVKLANRQQTNLHTIPGFLKYETPTLGELSSALISIDRLPDLSIMDIHSKEKKYADLLSSDSYLHQRYICDSWCAAFVWHLTPDGLPPITREVFGRIRSDYRNVSPETREEITRLREQYRFFHWHLEFPQVFVNAESCASEKMGGFDVVLGNPPWEHTEIKEVEWFAARHPDVLETAKGADRKANIRALERTHPTLFAQFIRAKREADGLSLLVRNSGRYPLCGRGRINTYAIFAETIRDLVAPSGYSGFIVPSGIATDDTTKFFFSDLVEKNSLVSLFDFENRRGIFPGVHRSYKFSLITVAGPDRAKTPSGADFVFFALDTADLADENKHFSLSADDLALLNPNTKTCPIFRSKKDAELTKAIYRRVPILCNENPQEKNHWGVSFKQGLFNMTSDSHHFRSAGELEADGYHHESNVFVSAYHRYLPLYEAKMVHHFDHRWATYDKPDNARDVTELEKQDTGFVVQPRYWVREEIVDSAIPRYPEPLAAALEDGHLPSMQRLLLLWAAGFHLLRSDTEAAQRNIEASRSFIATREVMKSLGEGTQRDHAIRLAKDFPLETADVQRIEAGEEIESAAKDLVDRFCPKWFVGFRRVCRTTDERSAIFSTVPKSAVGDSEFLAILPSTSSTMRLVFTAIANSFWFDYVVRQKIGGMNFNFFIVKQLPMLPPEALQHKGLSGSLHTSAADFLLPHTVELTYTAIDVGVVATECGCAGPPFPWNRERRFEIRCEIDAYIFHLCLPASTDGHWQSSQVSEGCVMDETELELLQLQRHFATPRDAVDYILEQFPIVRDKDISVFGHYRTKDRILEFYDAMQLCIKNGTDYQSIVSPPPGHR